MSTTMSAHHSKRDDFESDTLVAQVANTLQANNVGGGIGSDPNTNYVAHAFKASHFTRGKDGAPSEIAPPLSADADKGDQDTLICATGSIAHSLTTRAAAHDSQDPDVSGDVTHPLAFNLRGRDGGAMPEETDVASLRASSGGSSRTYVGVRRLTPAECERLQGFPDGYTAITYRGKPAVDGPRYKALGNSMAVPVIRWIGLRIIEALRREEVRW